MKNKTLIFLFLSYLFLSGGNLLAQYFTPVWEGNPQQDQMGFYIAEATIDGIDLQIGDSVAVLDMIDGELKCVGASKVEALITELDPLYIVAQQDEGSGNGYTEGNPIIFLFWDDSESKIYSLIDPDYVAGSSTVYASGEDTFLNSLTGYSANFWIGTDNDWDNPDNWNTGLLPDQFADVVISTDQLAYPTLTSAAECNNILIESDVTGTASLLDNGNLTVNGKATVETFLTNSATAGTFYLHLIGPTVDEQNYTGSGTGAFLSAFNIVPGSTYAYEYDESGAGWQALTSLSDEIPTGMGIALSTTDATDYTLSMTGDLITGDVSSPPLTHDLQFYEIISNPYPSAIDFDALATANSGVINNKYWIWDPSGPNYAARADGEGGSQYIQVGQGFFVETIAAGTFDFTNSERAHSSTPFLKSDPVNVLTVGITGGDLGYHDECLIRFTEGATFDYDTETEAVKWYSMKEDATMIYTLAADDTELAINALPIASLGVDNVSVPLHFQCGYIAEYTLNFTGMDSFDDAEIWLEDTQTGEEWIEMSESAEYSFIGNPEDDVNRFIIHFYGPTYIHQPNDPSEIRTYAHGETLYLLNPGAEEIHNISVYDLTGRLILESADANRKSYTINRPGNYVVVVKTARTIHTNKILITAN